MKKALFVSLLIVMGYCAFQTYQFHLEISTWKLLVAQKKLVGWDIVFQLKTLVFIVGAITCLIGSYFLFFVAEKAVSSDTKHEIEQLKEKVEEARKEGYREWNQRFIELSRKETDLEERLEVLISDEVELEKQLLQAKQAQEQTEKDKQTYYNQCKRHEAKCKADRDDFKLQCDKDIKIAEKRAKNAIYKLERKMRQYGEEKYSKANPFDYHKPPHTHRA